MNASHKLAGAAQHRLQPSLHGHFISDNCSGRYLSNHGVSSPEAGERSVAEQDRCILAEFHKLKVKVPQVDGRAGNRFIQVLTTIAVQYETGF